MGIIASRNRSNSIEDTSALHKFNWSAFWFDWVWGLANGALGKTKLIFVVMVCLCIPIVNLIAIFAYLGMKIYYGIKGNEWAYEGRAFYDIEDFNQTQKRWGIAAGVIFILTLIGIAIQFLIMMIFGAAMLSGFGGAGKSSLPAGGLSTPSTANMVIEDIITGESTNGRFNNGVEAANYLVNSASLVTANEAWLTASKYTSNSVQVAMTSDPNTVLYLFLVNKTGDCDLNAKNCYVITYDSFTKGEKPKVAEKVYFDNEGQTKTVKIKNK